MSSSETMFSPQADLLRDAAAEAAKGSYSDDIAVSFMISLARTGGVEFEDRGLALELINAERRQRRGETRDGSHLNVDAPARVLDPRDPLGVARTFVEERFTEEGVRLLHAWRDELRRWNDTHYESMSEADARALLYEFLAGSVKSSSNGREPFRPNSRAVSGILDALKAAAHLDSGTTAPEWLDGRSGPPVSELLPCSNGVLHVPTRDLLPHDPALFTTSALPYPYEQLGPEPAEWLAFLDSLWPEDPESIAALQEMLGMFVTGATQFQKIFMLVGPKRAGKGLIGRIARELLGSRNTAGPTLSSLTGNFGLQPLIDRSLAVISDARLSGRADQAVIVERLLAISGEDVLTVDRKHRDPWTGRMPTRFLILTNELPSLADGSGALASRFIVLTLQNSFYGREDLGLFARLQTELPGILRWALDGWDRLRERGYFVQPETGAAAIQDLEDLGSPVGAFVRECCAVETGAETPKADLYDRWRVWCRERGLNQVAPEHVFGRDLRAAVPGLSSAARRSGADRWRVYVGIRLLDAPETGDTG